MVISRSNVFPASIQRAPTKFRDDAEPVMDATINISWFAAVAAARCFSRASTKAASRVQKDDYGFATKISSKNGMSRASEKAAGSVEGQLKESSSPATDGRRLAGGHIGRAESKETARRMANMPTKKFAEPIAESTGMSRQRKPLSYAEIFR